MADPVKDKHVEGAVPEVWRPTLRAIVDSLVRRDVMLGAGLPAVDPLSADATLVSLPDEAWRTSVVRWYGDHWNCLVDLWTEPDG
jgi:hypothetical protein